jgi:dipeptidyl aminopeptidase/acylaminoacyl peptidase
MPRAAAHTTAACATLLAVSWLACGGDASRTETSKPAEETAPKSAQTQPTAAQPAPPTPPKEQAPAQYQGHGSASLDPALVEKFRPKPIDSALSRKLQALMDLRAPGVGELTPNGKQLYFSWSISGVPQLWMITGPDRFPKQLTGGEDRTGLAAITPDGQQLVVVRDRKGEENPGLYLQPAEGGELVAIQHLDGVQTLFEHLSDDGKSLYFSSNDRDRATYNVYRFDLTTREKSLAFEAEPGLWHVSDAKSDGRLLVRKETGSLWAEYFEWQPAAKKLVPLLGQNEHEDYVAKYGAKDDELIVLTNKLGEYRQLYRFAQSQLTPLTDALQHDVERFSIDRARKRVVYNVNERGYSRLYALDAASGKRLTIPGLPEADHIRLGATTPDARYSTLAIDDGRHPLQSFVLDWTTQTLTRWHTPSAPEIDTERFARAELAAYPARDGTAIPVFVRKPEKCARELCPVVVDFHGGPEGQSRAGFDLAGQAFVDAGFVLVKPNVRGSDGYGKTWLKADDGAKRLEVITDIEDAATWARTRFAVGGRKPRVGIYGGSYGGYAVLMGMTRFAGAYDAGATIVGISDLRTFLKNTAPYRRVLRISEYGDPERDAKALEQLSPVTFVDRVRAPLLIEQGATDPRVPAGEAIQIYEQLVRRNIECELNIFPDEGHGAQKRQNIVLMLGHAIEFFKRHLGS